VRIEKMSESKPSEDASLRIQALSKPRSPSSLGISLEDAERERAWRLLRYRSPWNSEGTLVAGRNGVANSVEGLLLQELCLLSATKIT
ncbi:hypothetical protein QCD80_28450, partial [Pseudomonas syringae pv. actinidiae]